MNSFLFVAGFAVSFFPTLLLLKNTNAPLPEVQSASVQAADVLTEISTPTPSPSPSPTPKPTLKPTPSPTPVPTTTPDPTPTPVPTPTPDVWSPPEMEPIFARYAGQYGVDKNILERLANCESHFNPNAVSRDGVYVGMFQFGPTTWRTYRQKIGEDPNTDLRRDIEESIQTAAYVISVQGTSPWPNCLR